MADFGYKKLLFLKDAEFNGENNIAEKSVTTSLSN